MVKLLYANDASGRYPDSWYAATATPLDPFAPLQSDVTADVCVIGAGYTGLSAALHLAEQGRDVVLIDAHRVGFGASGRNGGQLGSGQRRDQLELEAKLGRDDARKLWQMGEEAKALVKSLVERHEIDCYLRPGLMWTGRSPGETRELHAYADHMGSVYNHDLTPLDRDALQAICPSPDYDGGLLDMTAGHLHPLNYALGLARAAAGAGVRVFEQTEVLEIVHGAKPKVRTANGTVTADFVVMATNGYSQNLLPKVARHVMPINNFVAATEPLGDRVSEVLTRDFAVADSRFVINYFRLSHDQRLLFGGGETYGYRFPQDLKALVRRPMLEIFPHLKDIKLDYAWGGTLAITMHRLPYIQRMSPNVLSGSGYSGHGVGTATHAGWLMAKAICGETDGFDIMSAIPPQPFPGGPRLRAPLLVLAMTWYTLRDRIGF